MLIPVLLGTSIIVFSLVHFIPGDPARIIASEDATPEMLATIRKKYGLDKPLYIQYGMWLNCALHGDMGRSIISHESVTNEILDRFPNTFELSFIATVLATVIGIIA
ncbi:MAG: ABC transporter permease, partial [Candidatus Hodarchaeales archaeon]